MSFGISQMLYDLVDNRTVIPTRQLTTDNATGIVTINLMDLRTSKFSVESYTSICLHERFVPFNEAAKHMKIHKPLGKTNGTAKSRSNQRQC